VSVRDRGTAALTFRSPAAQPRHLRAGAGLVDEDQPVGVEVELDTRKNLARLAAF